MKTGEPTSTLNNPIGVHGKLAWLHSFSSEGEINVGLQDPGVSPKSS